MSDASKRIANLTPQQRELLLKLAAKKKAEGAPARPRIQPSAEPLRLSYQQRGLWVFQTMNPDSAAYNDGSLIRIRGPLDTEILRRSIEIVVNRHDSLRMRFEIGSEGPVPVVDPVREYKLSEIDLSELPATEQESAFEDLTRRKLNAPFDLAVEGVCRTALIRLGPKRHALYVVIHHIVNDAWSWGVFIRELLEAYEAFSKGGAPKFAPLGIQYGDYSAWQNKQLESDAWERKLQFWRDAWADGVPTVELPSDHPRPAAPSFRGGRAQIRISAESTQAIKVLARESKTTLFNVALAAYNALLHRYTGQRDLVIGTPVANRQQPELEPIIGFFVNMVAVPVKLEGDVSFRQLLQSTHDASRQAFVAQDVPFEMIVEQFQAGRDASRSPIFQALFVLQSAPTPKLEVSGLEFERQELHDCTARYDLTISLTEVDGGLTGFLEYSEELYERETGHRLAAHFARLLEGAARAPDLPVSKLPMLSSDEERRIRAEWNDTARDYPTHLCLHHLFEQRAAETPDAVAAVFGEQSLTYRALNERANRLARKLRAEHGVGPNAIVALVFERSLEMMVGILGALKAGGAYLPIDPSYPEDRVAYLGRDSACRAVLTHGRFRDKAALAGPTIDLEDLSQFDGYDSADLGIEQSSSDLAYVIYTSGSTGKPKGAMLEHAGVVNRLLWMRDEYRIGADDVILQKTIYTFDVSVWELLLPGICGARQVFLQPGGEGDPGVIERAIDSYGVTTMHFVPSMLVAFLHWLREPRRFASLRRVVCSGEALAVPHKDLFFAKILGEAELHNLYGPTEASIDVTYYAVQRDDTQIPIGRPVSNTRLYVLGAGDCLMPVGAPGELCLAGAQLARGYLNRPDLTEAKFVDNPFEPGQRMYRTGDLARWRSDGQIVYQGRIDSQVKVRGYRIELGEIEEALCAIDEVEEAVVIAAADGSGFGEKRLVAYLLCSPGATAATSDLRGSLLARLPQYMIPSAFVFLDAWPTNRNGKLDRARLPAPEVERRDLGARYEPPAPGLESFIAATWASTLGLERVGANDDFFELGGDSIKSIQISARANDKGLSVSPRLVFEFRTPRALAEALERSGAASGWSADEGAAIRLLPGQRFEEATLAERLDLSFAAPTSAAEVERRIANLVTLREALRLELDAKDPSAPTLRLGEPSIERIDLSGLSGGEQEEARRAAIASASARVLGAAGPLFAFRIFDSGSGLPVSASAVARPRSIDARSWALLAAELAAADGVAGAADAAPYGQAVALVAALPDATAASAFPGLAARAGSFAMDFPSADLIADGENALGLRAEETLLAAFGMAAQGIGGFDTTTLAFERKGHLDDVAGADLSRTLGAFALPREIALPEAGIELEERLKRVKETARLEAAGAASASALRFRYVGILPGSGSAARVDAFPWENAAASAPLGGLVATVGLRDACIHFSARYDADRFSEAALAGLAQRFGDALQALGDCLGGLTGRDFTPSDFAESGLDAGSLNSFLANL